MIFAKRVEIIRHFAKKKENTATNREKKENRSKKKRLNKYFTSVFFIRK